MRQTRLSGQPFDQLAVACALSALALASACSGAEHATKPRAHEPDSGEVDSGAADSEAGSDDEAPGLPTEHAMPSGGLGSDGRIVEACQGLPLKGMKYSPGGDTLPNKCAPFNLSTNNPYAVRCIDAMPDFKTPFPDDAACILPPPPEQGFQVGVHPGGNAQYWEKMYAGDYSFYRDSKVTGAYELAAGDETVQNYNTVFQPPKPSQYFYRRQFRGRSGSHHGVVYFARAQVAEDGWGSNGDLELGGGEVMTVQNAHTDYPPGSFEIPPEEMGLGNRISTTGVYFNLHHFNSTDKSILRENWINAWYIPADQVTKVARGIVSMAPINYPPGMVLDSSGSYRANGDVRVLNLWGHHHAWTTRFHASIKRAGGDEELIYDAYDWYDMKTFAYNSLAKNPAPGVEGVDGAYSGPIVLHAGDVINFNCHVETTQKHADALGIEVPSAPLKYGNQAYEAEMCILLGQLTTP